MKKITLKINKATVYDEVSKTSAYEGVKGSDETMALYDKVFVTDAEREQIERYWCEACSNLTAVLARWADSVSEHHIGNPPDLSEDFVAQCSMNDSFNEMLVPSTCNFLTQYAIDYILAKWFAMTDMDKAARYELTAAAALDESRKNIIVRIKRKRRVCHPF